MLNRRLGKFRVRATTIIHDPDFARAIMAEVIVIRAEHLLHLDEVEYLAISPQFSEVPLGSNPPWYLFEVQDGKARAIRERIGEASG